VIDYRDWQVSLGRRFRALKLWFVIRHYGVEGLQTLIRQHVALAETFVAWVRADQRFELAAPPTLSLICLRLKDDDAGTQQLLERLNAAGEVYLTGTKLAGRYAIRVNIGQTRTELRHVQGLWEAIRRVSMFHIMQFMCLATTKHEAMMLKDAKAFCYVVHMLTCSHVQIFNPPLPLVGRRSHRSCGGCHKQHQERGYYRRSRFPWQGQPRHYAIVHRRLPVARESQSIGVS
jgi:hypothetical protein